MKIGVLFLAVTFLFLSFVSLTRSDSWTPVHRYIEPLRSWAGFGGPSETSPQLAPWRSTTDYLNFPHKTPTLQENLRNDTYYLTAWAVSGYTNQFIAYINMLYLGFMSERVVIVPPFVPDHNWYQSPVPLPFGTVYNLTRLRDHLRRPILEWGDIKTGILAPEEPPSTPAGAESNSSSSLPIALVNETLGCWSTRVRGQSQVRGQVHNTEKALGLDVSYTRVPDFSWLLPDQPSRLDIKIPSLSALVTPKRPYAPPSSYPLMAPSASGSRLPPDQHLSCFDFLYFLTSGVKDYEFMYPWAPVWTVIGTHLRFTDHLQNITMQYLRKAFQIESEMPPMVTVHVRRGDFSRFLCQGSKPPCIIPVATYATAVKEIQEKLQEQGTNASHVFISSDENDPEFWKEVSQLGWRYFNHTEEATAARLGDYYPLLLDKVALSMGAGFVGTERSTFSVFNQRRVEDWNDGFTTLARFQPHH